MKRIITMLLCVCLLCSSTLYFAEEPISGADGEVVTVTQNKWSICCSIEFRHRTTRIDKCGVHSGGRPQSNYQNV